ncbi:MAG: hypothetical protein AVDCRST_MAG70-892, partial [uncultured Thermomicrobiales bacterium]
RCTWTGRKVAGSWSGDFDHPHPRQQFTAIIID